MTNLGTYFSLTGTFSEASHNNYQHFYDQKKLRTIFFLLLPSRMFRIIKKSMRCLLAMPGAMKETEYPHFCCFSSGQCERFFWLQAFRVGSNFFWQKQNLCCLVVWLKQEKFWSHQRPFSYRTFFHNLMVGIGVDPVLVHKIKQNMNEK